MFSNSIVYPTSQAIQETAYNKFIFFGPIEYHKAPSVLSLDDKTLLKFIRQSCACVLLLDDYENEIKIITSSK